MESHKLLPIMIKNILNKYASADKKMTQSELIEHLEHDYNLKISSHTCSDYIQEMRRENIISGSRGIYNNDYFSVQEIRILIDSLMHNKSISVQEAQDLINKLKNLSYYTLKDKFKNVVYFQDVNRTDNNNIQSIIDVIEDAINDNNKLKIYQYSPNADSSFFEWKPVTVDPYYITPSQGRYYLICNFERNGEKNFEARRIDRFLKVEKIIEKRTPLIDVVGPEFDLNRYLKEHIYMFSGDTVKAKIKLKNKDIGYLIDWFGYDFSVDGYEEKQLIVTVHVNENAIFYWALQYGLKVEIIEPDHLRNKIIDGLFDILHKTYKINSK